jgi:hypothetical protein
VKRLEARFVVQEGGMRLLCARTARGGGQTRHGLHRNPDHSRLRPRQGPYVEEPSIPRLHEWIFGGHASKSPIWPISIFANLASMAVSRNLERSSLDSLSSDLFDNVHPSFRQTLKRRELML